MDFRRPEYRKFTAIDFYDLIGLFSSPRNKIKGRKYYLDNWEFMLMWTVRKSSGDRILIKVYPGDTDTERILGVQYHYKNDSHENKSIQLLSSSILKDVGPYVMKSNSYYFVSCHKLS